MSKKKSPPQSPTPPPPAPPPLFSGTFEVVVNRQIHPVYVGLPYPRFIANLASVTVKDGVIVNVEPKKEYVELLQVMRP